MTAASNLFGNARYAAYAALDIEHHEEDPAWAVRSNINERIFVSARTGGFTFQPVFYSTTRRCSSSSDRLESARRVGAGAAGPHRLDSPTTQPDAS